MLIRISIFLLAVSVLWPSLAVANEAHRQLFVEALGKVESGAAEAEDYPGLRTYVLFPYLEAAELNRAVRRSPGEYTNQRVKSFLDKHGDTAYTAGLRVAWMRRLAEQGQWQAFLDYYPVKASEELECLAAQARIKLGREDARIAAESLWLVGKLRHRQCIAVFDWLQSSGYLTPALVEGRVRLAMEAGEYKVVESLVGKQGGQARARTQYWLWAYANPRDAITRVAEGGDPKMDAEMFTQVFRRLTQRDRDRAAALYDKAMSHAPIDGQTRQQLAGFIGFRYILNREPEALHWYVRSGNEPLREIESDWRIRSGIYAQAWPEVLGWINALPEEGQKTPRWLYWKGRALLAMGREDDAEDPLEEVSELRDFYGFMAADILDEDYAIEDRPVDLDDDVQQSLKARGDVQRAFELWKAGLGEKARSEFSALLNALNTQEQLQAGVLADEWGWWSRAIVSYGRGGYWDDLARRFPAPYRTLVTQEARRQGIDRAWIYGITRSESLFVRDARSPVGALGLMQLMPDTGRQVARQEGVKWRGTAMLYEPEYNIRFGSRYLRDMLKRFNGHIAMATAAYNAGPHNVNKWTPAKTLPADIWIEGVPFGATHNYLRHVLEFTATYEWRLTGEYTRLKQRLPPVPGK